MNDTMISEEHKKMTSAWPRFVIEMEGRKYGAEETLNSWLWFLTGWKKSDEMRQAQERMMKALAHFPNWR